MVLSLKSAKVRGQVAPEQDIDLVDLDRRAESASEDEAEFERFVMEYKPFLLSQVSKLAGGYSSSYGSGYVPNDIYEELTNDALLAFYESVKSYDREKGHFFPFMRTILRMRIVDSIRKHYTKRVATVSLEDYDDEGLEKPSAQVDAASLESYSESNRQSELAAEIESFKRELSEWGITMDALVEHSPKHARLKALCRVIIDAAAEDDEIMQTMWVKHYFPIKKISMLAEVPLKTVERERIFIIGSLIIRAGDYEYLKHYVTG